MLSSSENYSFQLPYDVTVAKMILLLSVKNPRPQAPATYVRTYTRQVWGILSQKKVV